MRKIIFHFAPKEWDHFFWKKKYHRSWWYKKHHIPGRFIWKDYFFRTFGKKIWCFVQSRFYEPNIVIISDPTFAMICLIPLQRRPDYDNVIKLLLVLFFYPVWKRWIFHQPEGPVNTTACGSLIQSLIFIWFYFGLLSIELKVLKYYTKLLIQCFTQIRILWDIPYLGNFYSLMPGTSI